MKQPGLIIMRPQAWFASALPLIIHVNDRSVARIEQPGTSVLIPLPGSGQYRVHVEIDGARCQPRALQFDGQRSVRFVFRFPYPALLCAIFNRSHFGSLERY